MAAKRTTTKFTVKVVYAPSLDSQERLERMARLLLARYAKGDVPPKGAREASNKVKREGDDDR